MAKKAATMLTHAMTAVQFTNITGMKFW